MERGAKLKKYLLLFLYASLLLSGCSAGEKTFKPLSKEGIAPYALSEDQRFLLESFGMASSSRLIAFLAPQEAITIEINVYRLTDSGTWERTGNGAMSVGAEREPSPQLSGTIAMELSKNYSMDFHINCSGQGSFSTPEIILDKAPLGYTRSYLETFQTIELNQEIPIAVMVYDSGTNMRSYVPQDYYDPSVFKGMDLVQAVTVVFSDKEIGG